jgi:hypothetical protein
MFISTTLGDRNIRMLAQAAKSGRFTVQASFSGYDKESHESIYVGSRFEDTSKKLQALYQTFHSEGVSDALAIHGIIMDAATKPIGFRPPVISLRVLICGRRIRGVRQNIFRHIPRRPRSQRHEVVVSLPGLAHRPDLRKMTTRSRRGTIG